MKVIEITDELDLHHFAPKEVADLVGEYLEAAHEKGFTRVRIIHGKGTGALRRTVHAALDRHARVARYFADQTWGATIVELA
ncbi:MAG TPA: Smr/MutS family protein [Kofleriaceae bacterium]|nr:Smr/MutS family protein [Kofleriaceae bacterium]